MLVIPRTGPFEARRFPFYSEFAQTPEGEKAFKIVVEEIAEWSGGEPFWGLNHLNYSAVLILREDQRSPLSVCAGYWVMKYGDKQFRIFTYEEFEFWFQEYGVMREVDEHGNHVLRGRRSDIISDVRKDCGAQ